MGPPGSLAKLCNVCSKLDTKLLAYPLYPCRNPEPSSCSEYPLERINVGQYLSLGSKEDVEGRRMICDICKLVAESLDHTVPSDIAGECRITEAQKYCSFELPRNVKTNDPTVTHFHLTKGSVTFDVFDQVQGPALPWEVKKRDRDIGHYVLHFQTKARSCPEPDDSASASTSLQSEENFLQTVGARYVGALVNHRLVRGWFHECESQHGEDCMPFGLAKHRKEPALIVDVIQSCIADTPSKCRYVALSYVWGRAAVFKHLLENSKDIRKTGSLISLPIPATIRDAIALVHAIGERYLWVDSLCIIQDDPKMQQSEIMRMGSIYSNALFTIVAAAGDNANAGLPGIRQGSRRQVQKVLKLSNCELLTAVDVHNPSDVIDETTWGQRAWTFQERSLSSRLLVFSKSQVYWKCGRASYSEEAALERVRNIDWHLQPFSHNQHADSMSWKTMEQLEYCERYDELLYNYRNRRLTYQTDILNAFNGVTEMLAVLQKDNFFWGLPGSFFSYALTWELTGFYSRNNIEVPIFRSNGTRETIPIPSWSWGAWSGHDEHMHHMSDLVDMYSCRVRSLIQFNIVDSEHQLVAIEEQPWSDSDQGRPVDGDSSFWQGNDAPSHQLPSLSQHHLLHIGQLHFWTSLATVKVIRGYSGGAIAIYYNFHIPSNFKPDADASVVLQDFIVVAARSGGMLILLAVEWKDGVAYRVGKTELTQMAWDQMENKQWRWITLG